MSYTGEQNTDADIYPKNFAPSSEPTAYVSDNIHRKPSVTGSFVATVTDGDSGAQPGQQLHPVIGFFIPSGFPKNGWCGMFLYYHFSVLSIISKSIGNFRNLAES